MPASPSPLCFTVIALAAAPALAAETTIHPIWATQPDLPREAEARQAFSELAARYQYGAVETMDIPGPPAPRAPELLKTGKAAVEKQKFDEAEVALDAAAAEVASTGGAGMETPALADLYLYQAMAAQKANWKDLTAPLGEITPEKAKQAYARAAALAPDRTLAPRQFPPIVVESWKKVTAEVRQRSRGSLLVRGAPSAAVIVDGGAVLLAPATVPGLPYGEHLVRVEVPGHAPWATTVTLAEPALTIDAPQTEPLMLADAEAAAHARRMGAAYALVGQMKPGTAPQVELRLIDAQTGAARDSTVVAFGKDRAVLDAAVMRLDEDVRRRAFAARVGDEPTRFTVANVPAETPRERRRFGDDPGAWLRERWPLVTAIGVAVGTAIVLGVVVASDERPPAPPPGRVQPVR